MDAMINTGISLEDNSFSNVSKIPTIPQSASPKDLYSNGNNKNIAYHREIYILPLSLSLTSNIS